VQRHSLFSRIQQQIGWAFLFCHGYHPEERSPREPRPGRGVGGYLSTPALQHSNTPTLQHSSTPALQHSNTPTLQHSNTPTLQHSNTPAPQHPPKPQTLNPKFQPMLSTPTPDRRSSLYRFYRWFNYGRSAWLTAALIAVVLLVTLAVRLLTYQEPEWGGDGLCNWIAATHLRQGEFYEMRLNSSRMGVIFPAVLMQMVFGDTPLVYSFTPLLMCLITVACSFFITRKLAGRIPALFVALAMLLFPPWTADASYLLPDVFQAAYITAMTLCFVLYLSRPSAGVMLAAGILLALTYASKITALFFFPAAAVIVVLHCAARRHIVYFAAGVLMIYACEHVWYYQMGLPGGRYQLLSERRERARGVESVLTESLGERPKWSQDKGVLLQVTGFSDFFRRYRPEFAGQAWATAFLYWLVGSLYLLGFSAKRYHVPVIVMGCHVLFNTFAIQRLHPPVLLTLPWQRYLGVYSGLIFVIVVLFAWHLARRLAYRKLLPQKSARCRQAVGWFAAGVAVFSLVFCIILPWSRGIKFELFQTLGWAQSYFAWPLLRFTLLLGILILGGTTTILLVRLSPEWTSCIRRGLSECRSRCRNLVPLQIVLIAWAILFPQMRTNYISTRWGSWPTIMESLARGEHPSMRVSQHYQLVTEAYRTGRLLISPVGDPMEEEHYIASNTLRRALGLYTARSELASLKELAWIPFDNIVETVIRLNDKQYFAVSKFSKEEMLRMAHESAPDMVVLYIWPETDMRAEYRTVSELGETGE
jgi:4-amino-4-deoxy-L-arabinose transferase-like glycosyltransferase